jgi:hypothetical protein
MSAPTTPLALGRSSTMTFWPGSSPILGAIRRAMRSFGYLRGVRRDDLHRLVGPLRKRRSRKQYRARHQPSDSQRYLHGYFFLDCGDGRREPWRAGTIVSPPQVARKPRGPSPVWICTAEVSRTRAHSHAFTSASLVAQLCHGIRESGIATMGCPVYCLISVQWATFFSSGRNDDGSAIDLEGDQ